jgi:hypothetical protein
VTLDELHERLHRRTRFGRSEVDCGDELTLQREHDLLGDGLAGLVLACGRRRGGVTTTVSSSTGATRGGLRGEHAERRRRCALARPASADSSTIPPRGVHDAQGGLAGEEPAEIRPAVPASRQVDGEGIGVPHEIHSDD